MKNYYEILQVQEDADYEKIDEAYWRLARESTAPSDDTQYTIDDLNERTSSCVRPSCDRVTTHLAPAS